MEETLEPKLGDDGTIARRILHDLGYFGHFLHVHAGGRSGKQHILVKLLKNGGSMSQRDLMENSCISSASISEVTAKLEAEGLITRTKSDSDRRQLTLELTDAGIARAEESLASKRAFEQQAFSCLDEQEQLSLLELCDRIFTHWNTIETAEKEA